MTEITVEGEFAAIEVVPPEEGGISEAEVRKALGRLLRRFVAVDIPSYPVVIEEDGSRWLSLDWVIEKIEELPS